MLASAIECTSLIFQHCEIYHGLAGMIGAELHWALCTLSLELLLAERGSSLAVYWRVIEVQLKFSVMHYYLITLAPFVLIAFSCLTFAVLGF